MDGVSTESLLAPTRTNGRSNMRRLSSIRNRTATTSAGLMSGSVMRSGKSIGDIVSAGAGA
jgi:hypothetical protein